jgi:hypothetical protein
MIKPFFGELVEKPKHPAFQYNEIFSEKQRIRKMENFLRYNPYKRVIFHKQERAGLQSGQNHENFTLSLKILN